MKARDLLGSRLRAPLTKAEKRQVKNINKNAQKGNFGRNFKTKIPKIHPEALQSI